MGRLSVKVRITIWYTIFLVIITAGFLAILTYSGNVRAGELARTRLADSVSDARDQIGMLGESFIIDDDLGFYEDGVYLSVYDASGELIEGRRPAELADLPDFGDNVMKKLEEGGETWYVYDNSFDMDGKTVWVRGIAKDFAEGGTFSFVIRFAAIAFPALVVLAALGGYLITRRAFKPVRNILQTVDEISADGDLSRRIETGDSPDSSRDEIYHLTSAFNGMFDNLQRAFEKEKRFTSDVSHELRTPLSVIISQSDYALEDEEYRKKSLEVINREAKRMAGLVNRLLTLARSDAGRLRPEREKVDMSDMCETVAWQQEGIAAEKGIAIETQIEEGVFVYGDETMLIRVILNLMDNAIKYGKKNGHVKLKLRIDNGQVCCEVEDDGIGIRPEDMPRIWERFYRVEGSRSEEGSGLGLAMVEAMVKAHGGQIDAESVYGEGSRFTVRLPLYEGNEEERQ